MQPSRVRRRALLFGTGWTLIVATGIGYFKSSASGPIYLWTLGLVALGWTAVLLHALAAARRAEDACIAAAERETRVVVGALAQALEVEMERAGKELARVDELLGHAIGQLMTVFNSLGDQLGGHRGERAHEADAGRAPPAAEQPRAAAAGLASDLNVAITAMQFRDVVGQKLGHVRQELEALEQLMRRVRDLSLAPPAPAPGPVRAPLQPQLVARVHALLRELEQAKAASPAQQQLMHAGEVDLF